MILIVISILAILSLFGMPWTYALMIITTYILSRRPNPDLSSGLVPDTECSCVNETLKQDKIWKQFRVKTCFGFLSQEETRKDLMETYSNTVGGLQVCKSELSKANDEIRYFYCDSLESWNLSDFTKSLLSPIIVGGVSLFLLLRLLPMRN